MKLKNVLEGVSKSICKYFHSLFFNHRKLQKKNSLCREYELLFTKEGDRVVFLSNFVSEKRGTIGCP
jgi:hypothetical protein